MSARSLLSAHLLFAPKSPCHLFHSTRRSRLFSTTGWHSDSTPSHYDVLKLPPTCTPAELKKQFYVLSKETHPDIHPNDPHASTRFSQISESYSILADPEKRRRYDRDFMRSRHAAGDPTANGRAPGHTGSYAGSRPASGLSKRRGVFRGPPPSYYTQGGSASSRPDATNPSSSSGGSFNPDGPSGQFTDGPEFDSSRVFRTQRHEDTRRTRRRDAAVAAARDQAEDEDNFWARFAVVSGIIVVGVSVASIVGNMGEHKGGLLRGDGSRRDRPERNTWAKG